MSLASHPDERTDAIEVYVRRPGDGTLARAFSTGGGRRSGGAVQRAASGALRGGLTTWVHVGMLVRRMRGRSDPLQGLGQRDTFQALCRLAQAAVEGTPAPTPPGSGPLPAHLRVFTTPYPAETALGRLQQVLQPYAAAGTVTRTGRAVIAWFAIRHLIAVRSGDYSLQVVHLTPEGGRPCQVSLMLPRDPVEEAAAAGVLPERLGPRRLRRRAQREAAAAALASAAAAIGPGPEQTRPGSRPDPRWPADAAARASAPAPAPAPAGPLQLRGYLDAYREHLTRELLLEPVSASGPVPGFAWTPEPTGDGGGVAIAGTVPAAIRDEVVLRMAAQAVAQLGERSPEFSGAAWGDAEPDGELLVRRWLVGAGGSHLLSVAARSGDRRRPTQVLIHLVAREADPQDAGPDGTDPHGTDPHGTGPEDAHPVDPDAGRQLPRSGPDVEEARGLTMLPLWWHSANARCDGNDVILYEMPFRGRKLRIRANDYPAEPMYTLLVGEPGAEVAAVDLEDWPAPWTRPRA